MNWLCLLNIWCLFCDEQEVETMMVMERRGEVSEQRVLIQTPRSGFRKGSELKREENPIQVFLIEERVAVLPINTSLG